ncbi:hypothetical protein, partial [Pseudorhodobacter sp. E13]|uniref:hypothetical protein n=1 Tax=Pseudorhodobacter sp. E13 TaxID=2487931 RepID=UPI001F22D223
LARLWPLLPWSCCAGSCGGADDEPAKNKMGCRSAFAKSSVERTASGLIRGLAFGSFGSHLFADISQIG